METVLTEAFINPTRFKEEKKKVFSSTNWLQIFTYNTNWFALYNVFICRCIIIGEKKNTTMESIDQFVQ